MKLQDILIWVFFILSVVFVIWYIFGSSPSFEQTILVLILSLLIANLVKTNVLETRFKFLVRDFKKHIGDHK